MDRDAPEGFPATGLTRVGAPYPPKLEEALGYEGGLGYVAFYWEPAGDELRWCDGVVDTEGSWHAWLAFVGHPAVEPHVRPFEFGNSETPSAHWLLLDRGGRTLYAASPEVVARFLRASLPPRSSPPARRRYERSRRGRTTSKRPSGPWPKGSGSSSRPTPTSLWPPSGVAWSGRRRWWTGCAGGWTANPRPRAPAATDPAAARRGP